MATTDNSRPTKPASTAKATATTAKTTARKGAGATKTVVAQAQVLAERAVLVPVGASLLARENLVSTVKVLSTRYGTRASVERELKRYERRGASARNRFERQVRRTRTTFQRELRQRRSTLERTVKQNRRRVQREVKSVRKDVGRQSGTIAGRVEKLVAEAQDRITTIS
jgi:hypothetical protein